MIKITEIASEIVKIDTPTPADLAKPAKIIKKSLGIVELAAGGVLEKNVIAPVMSKLPMPAPELADAVELIAIGLATEYIQQADISNVLGGAAVSVAIRLGDRIIQRIKGAVKKPAVVLTGTPVIHQNMDGGDFF